MLSYFKREPKLCKDVKPLGNPLDVKTSLAIMLNQWWLICLSSSIEKKHLHIPYLSKQPFSIPVFFQRKLPLSIQSPTQILRRQQQEKNTLQLFECQSRSRWCDIKTTFGKGLQFRSWPRTKKPSIDGEGMETFGEVKKHYGGEGGSASKYRHIKKDQRCQWGKKGTDLIWIGNPAGGQKNEPIIIKKSFNIWRKMMIEPSLFWEFSKS